MRQTLSGLALFLLCLPTGAAAAGPEASSPAWPAIDGAAVLEHVKVLSSDAFEGRAPGSHGEELTVGYLTEQLQKMGIQPGNPDGTYIQEVPLVGTKVKGQPTLTFQKGDARQELVWRDDFVAWTKRVVDQVRLDDSELVFAGYGVQAPEFSWDDFKGLDVKGKTIVVLVGDPPVPDPDHPAELDPETFGGKAMTYYGRWSYKYELGAKLGAAGVLIVHETEPAGYPFVVVQGRTAEQFELVTPDQGKSRLAVEGWITLDRAKELFAMAGQDFEALKRQAVRRDFRPVDLGVTAALTLDNQIRTLESRNVVGKLEGSDPRLKDEYVIYTAHWDHFGIGVPVNGDPIYHGAIDNASGVAGVMELARAFTQVEPPARRSILFLFVTAEEQGLLGSAYYADHPLYPEAKTLADINIDGLNVHGRTRDLVIIGLGLSDLDDIAEQAASAQKRKIGPDPMPEKGSYYRSDHFPFARKGVPAINAGGGVDFVGRPADYGKKIRDDYIAHDYHKPSDQVRPDWDMSGAVEDLELFFRVGYEVAQGETFPAWKPGAEFEAQRLQMLSATSGQ
jgi:Zn-dependent M28 family amino/carboxypeptidase